MRRCPLFPAQHGLVFREGPASGAFQKEIKKRVMEVQVDFTECNFLNFRHGFGGPGGSFVTAYTWSRRR